MKREWGEYVQMLPKTLPLSKGEYPPSGGGGRVLYPGKTHAPVASRHPL